MAKKEMSPEARAKMLANLEKARANRKPKVAASEPASAEPEAKPPSKEAKPKSPPMNLFSGNVAKLQIFDPDGNAGIPGFATRWFTDEGNSGVRINAARRSGWDFVTRDEVALNDSLTPLNTNLGDHVTMVVNPHAEGGKPELGYLMKIPQELFDRYQNERENTVHANIEHALRAGAMNRSSEARQYSANSDIARATHSSLPGIEMGTKIYR